MGNQDDIEQKFMDFRKKQTLFIAASFIVNAAVVMLLCLYYNLKQRALTGALYLYDKTAAENYLDVLSKLKITQAVGRYVNEGNTAIEKIGYGSKGYNYIFLLSGEIWIYIIALLILSVIFICGIVSIRSMTSNSVIADASAVKERNVILENRLKQEAEYNKKQQRKMQDFIENIAHQIKTPLSVMTMKLEMLQDMLVSDTEGSSTIANASTIITECTKSAFKIKVFIKKLLDISRIESGKVVLASDKVIIDYIVEESVESAVVDKSKVIVDYGDAIKRDMYADEGWLVEAFVNIISNSYEYICDREDGRVYIDISSNNEVCMIKIADNGDGIDKEHLAYIFDRFEGKSSQDEFHAGIGLNLSKLIIEAHHGSIKAGNSDKYGGAEFRIILPLYKLKGKIEYNK